MTSLLSQFTSLAAEVNSQSGKKPEKTATTSDARQRSGKTRSEKSQEKYREIFESGNTVAKAAALLGISHVGCLNQVYRYEARDLMYREGRDDDTGGIIFFWKVGNT